MKTGKVKWFNDEKGYGFISGDDGTDIYVHFTGINGRGRRTLLADQSVSYEEESTDRGMKAVNVTIL